MSVVNDSNRERLLANPNVKSLTSSHVVYTPEFKKSALKDYENGISGRLIWLNAGFDLDDFISGYFRKALKRWQKQANKTTADDWTNDNRGRPRQQEFLSEKEELEYLRAENHFLKELHALVKNLENK